MVNRHNEKNQGLVYDRNIRRHKVDIFSGGVGLNMGKT